MDPIIIRANVANKVVSVEGDPTIVCNNSCYKVEFTFDREWNDSAIKTARFTVVHGKKTYTYDRVFTGNVVDVPILEAVEFVEIGVYSGDIQTTTSARVKCKLSSLCNTGYPPAPTDDVYKQLIALFNGVSAGSVFLKYSASPDGANYTGYWQEGFNYMGVAVGTSEPTNVSAYTWMRFIGEKGEPGTSGIYVGSGIMPANCNIQIDVMSAGAILRVKDAEGNIYDIPTIKGADGQDGTDGVDGKDGQDGITPHIGPDGNWVIGTQNTGVCAGQKITFEEGSYVGTGTYGSANPTSITLNFMPKIIFVNEAQIIVASGEVYRSPVGGYNDSGDTMSLSVVENGDGTFTFSWYYGYSSDNGALYQLNANNRAYHYVAIG